MTASNQSLSNVANSNIALISSTDENTFRVLQETLYPGSTDQEVAMILSYCKARRIDPILKPVHLVPMSVKTDKKTSDGKFVYERKNVIMPGIGLYRIDASRSGQYAGMNEPEFGEEVTEKIGEVTVSYPRWCKVTVKKLLPNGSIAEFTAKEYWKENYASKSKFDKAPNDVWSTRMYGQIAKCAEAQALRKAFPDVVGNEYTKEEMEGKNYHHDDVKPQPKPISKTYEAEKVEKPVDTASQEIHEIDKDLMDISWAENVDSLKEIYTKAYKFWMNKKHKENMKKCVDAKDKKVAELESAEEVDPETGEIK